tara:strand:+ start:2483 stop:3700 length:1218 start_codon:yes stop_codon:yes gene_type:complete
MISYPFTYENLYRCYLNCRKNKRNKVNSLRFEINAEEELQRLLEELTSGSYVPSQSTCFITNKPKYREIFAADFRDRVLHHLLVSYFEPKWEKIFIYDSYACRKGKGTHAAVKKLQSFMRKVSCNRTKTAWFLHIDIRSFFVSINKKILFEILTKKEKDERITELIKIIIFYDPTKNHIKKGQLSLFELISPHKTLFNTNNKTGLPIGNYTSQFFANVYLNDLDQFVKHILKCRFYIRYVDDLVLLHESKQVLQGWEKDVDSFLKKKLALCLNWKRRKIARVGNGCDFLGYIVQPTHLLARRRTITNFTEKLNKYQSIITKPWYRGTLFKASPEELSKLEATVASYEGQFRHAATFRLLNKIKKKYLFLRIYFKANRKNRMKLAKYPKFWFLNPHFPYKVMLLSF